MNLYGEILAEALRGRELEVTIKGADVQAVVSGACYRALERIQAILKDDSLTDPECFQRIEAIVRVYEDLGSGAGSRHDFG